jgi:hypothetical protein
LLVHSQRHPRREVCPTVSNISPHSEAAQPFQKRSPSKRAGLCPTTPAPFAITGLCPGSKGGFQSSRHQYAAGGGRASLARIPGPWCRRDGVALTLVCAPPSPRAAKPREADVAGSGISTLPGDSRKASTAPPLRQWSEPDRSRARRRGRAHATYEKKTHLMLPAIPNVLTRSKASVYLSLVNFGGPSGRNWFAASRANGVSETSS